MKKSREEQRHLAQSRRGAESEKKTKALSALNLCVSASLREFIDSFTPSDTRATSARLSLLCRAPPTLGVVDCRVCGNGGPKDSPRLVTTAHQSPKPFRPRCLASAILTSLILEHPKSPRYQDGRRQTGISGGPGVFGGAKEVAEKRRVAASPLLFLDPRGDAFNSRGSAPGNRAPSRSDPEWVESRSRPGAEELRDEGQMRPLQNRTLIFRVAFP